MPTRSPIFYFARIVPEYRRSALALLNECLEGRLVVCSGEPPEGSSLHTIRADPLPEVRSVALKNVWIAGERLHVQDFRPAFRAYGRPSVILAEESPRSISLPLLMMRARSLRIPLGLWGHFSSNRRAASQHTWQDGYRQMLARRANACICYTPGVAERLRGVPEQQRFVATNTLDTQTLFDLDDRLAAEGRNSIRRRLGLPGEIPLLAYIGRITDAKGADTLLDLVGLLQRDREVGLVVIGDGPARARLQERLRRERLQHVIFLGALRAPADSAPYLFASDVMVLPGPAGLAINHAFALGLPVVTVPGPDASRYHGPEIEYLEHGVNGRIAGGRGPDALAAGVLEVLERRAAYSEAARSYAREHLRLEDMVAGLTAAIRFMKAQSDRSISP